MAAWWPRSTSWKAASTRSRRRWSSCSRARTPGSSCCACPEGRATSNRVGCRARPSRRVNFPRVRRASLLATIVLLLAGAEAQAQEPPTRYSLAGGCYTVTGPDGRPIAGAERVRMQATTLGRYLLYLPDRTFVAAGDDGSVGPAPRPSPAADWRVDPAPGGTFALSPMSDGKSLTGVKFA